MSNTIEGIDELRDRTGADLLPLTTDDKINMWKNEVNVVQTLIARYLQVDRLPLEASGQ